MHVKTNRHVRGEFPAIDADLVHNIISFICEIMILKSDTESHRTSHCEITRVKLEGNQPHALHVPNSFSLTPAVLRYTFITSPLCRSNSSCCLAV